MTVSGSFLLLRINVIVSCDFFAVFEVDSRNAGTDAAEDLVIYCAVKGSKFIGCDGLISVGADNGDHLADFYIVHIAKVYHKLIHADTSDDGASFASKEKAGAGFGKVAAVAVSITDGHGSNVHILFRCEGAAVAYGGTLADSLYIGYNGFKA